jgi:hypothetical protein
MGAPAATLAQSNLESGKARIERIIKEHPEAGQALAHAIARAVEADPSLANAVVQIALTATTEVQTALGEGLAEAAVYFANSNLPDAVAAQQEIQAAMASAPGSTVTAFNSSGGAAALLSLLGTSSGAGTTLTTSNCVSLNRPGHGC